MPIVGRSLKLLFPLLIVTVVIGLGTVSSTSAATPSVTMFDNDAPATGFDPGQAQWGYAPTTVTATAGQAIVFANADSNKHPHTITSLERVGSPFANQMKVGERFDSSPDQTGLIMPGQSFTLDTTSLQPGNYTYYCKLHPWMVGTFTVVAPS